MDGTSAVNVHVHDRKNDTLKLGSTNGGHHQCLIRIISY